MDTTPPFFVPLPELAVIEAVGADAVSFLHGQLTQDVEGLPDTQARLAGYCTAKGRLLATMVIWKDTRDEAPILRALVRRDLADTLVKRLTMFVLRAKVKLSITELAVYGHAPQGLSLPAVDASAATQSSDETEAMQIAAHTLAPHASDAQTASSVTVSALQDAFPGDTSMPDDAAPWTLVRHATTTWIAAPAKEHSPTRWWLVSEQASDKAEPKLAQSAGLAIASGADQAWQAADITAGLPWVQASTQDMFIPQTLNFDLIEGVNFTKGCYPGQEVVARAHYRGTVKRRMACGVLPVPQGLELASLPGTDTFNATSPGNPCGRIINAAQTDGLLYVLMEVQLADLGQADFRLGTADGPRIREHALPYQLAAIA